MYYRAVEKVVTERLSLGGRYGSGVDRVGDMVHARGCRLCRRASIERLGIEAGLKAGL